MLQAMNTGHDGSLTTIHANTPRDALYRLDTMVAMANLNIPEKADPPAGRVGHRPRRAGRAPVRRHRAGSRRSARSPAWSGTSSPCRTSSCSSSTGCSPDGQGHRPLPRHRHPAAVRRAARRAGLPAAARDVRAREAGGVRADHADASSHHLRRRARGRVRRLLGRSSLQPRRPSRTSLRKRLAGAAAPTGATATVAAAQRRPSDSARFRRSTGCCARRQHVVSPLQQLIDACRR